MEASDFTGHISRRFNRDIEDLRNRVFADVDDEEVVRLFLDTKLPEHIYGDLAAFLEEVRYPLAVRSSSLLEDSQFQPFAGVYATKMIPNNQVDADNRFLALCHAIRFVSDLLQVRDAATRSGVEMLLRFTAAAAKLRLGDPLDPETDIGPMVDAAAVERTERWVAAAVAASVTLGAARIERRARRVALPGRHTAFGHVVRLITGNPVMPLVAIGARIVADLVGTA